MSSNGVFNLSALLEETVWPEASMLQAAEAEYQALLSAERRGIQYGGGHHSVNPSPVASEQAPLSTLASEIANVRSRIQNFMKAPDGTTDTLFPFKLVERIQHLEEENAGFAKTLTQMSKDMQDVKKMMNALNIRLSLLDMTQEGSIKTSEGEPNHQAKETLKNGTTDDDDDVDLFGSDEETEEDRRVKEERLKAYESKKAKKTQVIAKSSVVLDVKPWSDETDLKDMEINVRKIESVGLKWGAAKLVPLAYGIKKLQIIAIVEDDNCSIDWLQEQIEAIEDLVQSVDIAAFNKL